MPLASLTASVETLGKKCVAGNLVASFTMSALVYLPDTLYRSKLERLIKHSRASTTF